MLDSHLSCPLLPAYRLLFGEVDMLPLFLQPLVKLPENSVEGWPTLQTDPLDLDIRLFKRQIVMDMFVVSVLVTFTEFHIGIVVAEDVPHSSRGIDAGLIAIEPATDLVGIVYVQHFVHVKKKSVPAENPATDYDRYRRNIKGALVLNYEVLLLEMPDVGIVNSDVAIEGRPNGAEPVN